MVTAIAVVVSLLVGFGLGRVKNAAKLKSVSAVLKSAETNVGVKVESVIAAIRAKL
jgi:hypothetical protein